MTEERECLLQIRILLILKHTTAPRLRQALQAGSNGILCDALIAEDHVLTALQIVLAGGEYIDPGLAFLARYQTDQAETIRFLFTKPSVAHEATTSSKDAMAKIAWMAAMATTCSTEEKEPIDLSFHVAPIKSWISDQETVTSSYSSHLSSIDTESSKKAMTQRSICLMTISRQLARPLSTKPTGSK